MDVHRHALESLVRFEGSLEQLRQLLALIPQDAELDPPVGLKGAELLCVLQRYLGGRLDAADLVGWAELFEGRSDIRFEDVPEFVLDQFMTELAHPALYGAITRISIESKVNQLRSLNS